MEPERRIQTWNLAVGSRRASNQQRSLWLLTKFLNRKVDKAGQVKLTKCYNETTILGYEWQHIRSIYKIGESTPTKDEQDKSL